LATDAVISNGKGFCSRSAVAQVGTYLEGESETSGTRLSLSLSVCVCVWTLRASVAVVTTATRIDRPGEASVVVLLSRAWVSPAALLLLLLLLLLDVIA
jgi:hypothetical protein